MRACGMVKWNSVPAVVLKPSGQHSKDGDRRVRGRENETGINL